MNVARHADEQLARQGDDPESVIVVGGEDCALSRSAVHDAANRLAARFVKEGVAPGDRVALLLPNGVEVVAGFLATLRAGGVVVIMSPELSASEVERVLAHADVRLLVTNEALARRVTTKRVTTILSPSTSPLEALTALSAGHEPLDVVARAPEDVAQIAYTSGTTGAPRAVRYTHASLAARLRFLSAQGNRGDAQPMVNLVVLPLAHAYGTTLLLQRLVQPMRLVLAPGAEPRMLLAAIERHHVTHTQLVPAMGEAILAVTDRARDLSSLRSVVIGGATVSETLLDALAVRLGIRPTVAYGLTELPGVTFRAGPGKPGSVGRLIPGVQIRVVGPDGADVATGAVGEIWLKSAWMSSGDGTQDGARSDGWLRTGDVGKVDAERELFLVGRSKEIIIQAGNNLYPTELVDFVRELPGVRECAVVGVPNDYLGEEAVACVVVDPGVTLTASDVLRHLRARVDARRVPVSVRFVDELPKTELGKVRSQVLKERIRVERATVVETTLVTRLRGTPAGARREVLRQTVEERAIDNGAAPDDGRTLRERGLDSLAAVRFTAALAGEIGRPLPPTLAFNAPTTDAVAQALDVELFGAEAPPARRRTRAGSSNQGRIAVIGLACRFPGGADTPERFWSLLRDGIDASGEVPASRWSMDEHYDATPGTPGKSYVRRGSFVDGAEQFDAPFFGITPREARTLDPQHRQLLEVAWEALERAGLDPFHASRGPTGVFIGISGSSYPSQSALGVQPSMATGRISHFLDLSGPSFAIDSACSSSLVAAHSAIRSLRNGECDLALAGGVNVMCSPIPFVGLSTLRALAPDGRCKAFDARADGFGRGEGCAILVLKRLEDAQRDDDDILALLRGSAVNNDGHSASLTAPSGPAQRAVIEDALADAGLDGHSIDYLEAHGTGTPLGDPIEVEAAAAVLGANRDPARPLVLGSVKTNIGHLEAAAGAAALVKVVLALQHEAIPANLHLERLNPALVPHRGVLQVPTALMPWPARLDHTRRAGITSMGLSGTNAHVVLEEAPPRAAATSADPGPRIVCFSAAAPAALVDLVARHEADLARADVTLADRSVTSTLGRASLRHRLAIVASNVDELRDRLAERTAALDPEAAVRRRAPLAFLFTGQGAQSVGMGRRLYDRQRTFRAALHRCAEITQDLLPRPLLDVLFSAPPDGALTIDDTALAQPALFALEWSLAQLWASWGVEPDFVAGHSLGELVAACVAGVFTVEDGLQLAAARGRLMQALPRGGAMVAFSADEALVRAAVEPHLASVAVSAINGPQSIVVSGARDAVDQVSAALSARGITPRPLKVSHAFHSPLMDSILDEFDGLVAGVRIGAPARALVSTLTGEVIGADTMSQPGYWRRQLREPVRFCDAMRTLDAAGCRLFLEVGPSPVLVGMARGCVGKDALAGGWASSLRRDRDDEEQLLGALATLWEHGVDPMWASVHGERGGRRATLPTYPFQHEPYWISSSAGPRVTSSSAAPARPREAAATTRLRELAALPREERAQRITIQARQLMAHVLGRKPDALPIDRSLLEEGVDSLRVMDFLSALRRSVAVECTPADLLTRPRLVDFAAHLADQIENQIGAIAQPASTASPLVTLQASGAGTPLYCFHPSGGQVTAYLRLAALVGNTRPVHAIQSRGVGAPEREHTSIEAIAKDYAALIAAQHDRSRPLQLAGWSLGGAIAYAVAGELERNGFDVVEVVLIDAPARALPATPRQRAAAILLGVLYELHSSLSAEQLTALRDIPPSASATDLLAWCHERALFSREAISPEAFAATMALRERHFDLLLSYQPSTILRAPLRVWWADAPFGDWSSRSSGVVRTERLGPPNDHYSVVRSPAMDQIVAALQPTQLKDTRKTS